MQTRYTKKKHLMAKKHYAIKTHSMKMHRMMSKRLMIQSRCIQHMEQVFPVMQKYRISPVCLMLRFGA